jgi:hypothetical protein
MSRKNCFDFETKGQSLCPKTAGNPGCYKKVIFIFPCPVLFWDGLVKIALPK